VNAPDAPAVSASDLTVGSLRRRIAARLARSGRTGTPDLDASLLIAHARGGDAGTLLLDEDRAVDRATAAAAMALAERRVAGEPVARIVGHKAFYGIDLALSPATLVPRPDTETVVEAALEILRRDGRTGAPIRILDPGTGSGAILLALLAELPTAGGVGTDISTDAIATARDNARRLGLADRAAFVVGDWLRPVGARFDIVAANPPYVVQAGIASLEPEVRDHDPVLALDGGADGLAAIAAILGDLDGALATGGAALVEIGMGQGPAVAGLADAVGFAAAFRRDLAGIERVAVLRRRADVPKLSIRSLVA
jgi:release factor glutamine methyltransferase